MTQRATMSCSLMLHQRWLSDMLYLHAVLPPPSAGYGRPRAFSTPVLCNFMQSGNAAAHISQHALLSCELSLVAIHACNLIK